MKTYYVYIITNRYNTVLYIGVTSNIKRRMYEHTNKIVDGFSKKYNLNKLVYYEEHNDINNAILREKFLKGKKREYKNILIQEFNPNWDDLITKFDLL